MKRAVSIFLSALLLFNSLGYVVFFHQARYQVRSMMRAEVKLGMNSPKTEKVIIYYSDIRENKISFKRVEKNEFRLNGQMYDIVKEEQRVDCVIFYCLMDIKESALEQLFACLVESNSAPDKSRPAQSVLKSLIKDGVSPDYPEETKYPTREEFFESLSAFIPEGEKTPVYHPPNLLFI